MSAPRLDPDRQRELQRATEALCARSSSWHRREGTELRLVAAVGLPAPLVAAVERLPKGKGMAGQAWARGIPVSTCDLQRDPTTPAAEVAKRLPLRAAVAIPIFDEDGALAAVIGFAFDEEENKLSRCIEVAEALASVP